MKVTLPVSPYDLHPVLRAFCVCIMLVEVGLIAADWFVPTARSDAIGAFGLTLNWRNEPFRVVSHVLVHGDSWHMLFNLIPILLFGDALALIRGIAEMTLVIVVSIVAGAVGFIVIGIYPATIGASAVAFGLAAACLVHWSRLTMTHRIALVAMGATIAPSMFWWTGIAWEAHVCAALAGGVVALVLNKLQTRKNPWQSRSWKGAKLD